MAATVIAGNDFGLLDSSLAILKRGDQTNQNKVGGQQDLYINASNGNLILQQEDVYLPSLGEDFKLVRTYNSQAKLHGESNWSLSTGVNLSFRGPLIIVEKGDGSEFDYRFDSELDLWVTTDGSGAYETVEKVHNSYWPFKADPELDPSIGSDHFGYVLTRADQSKMYFDARGKLMASVDTNSVRMDYKYDRHSKLVQISDDQGHEINFCYDHWGRLTSLHDEQENNLVEYEYSFGRDRLTSVTDRNGLVTKYSYDNHGLLTSIELPNKQMVDGKLEHYESRKLEFSYSFESIPSTHRGWGPTLSSIKDAEGGLTTFEYFDDSYCWYLDNGGSTRVVDGLGNARAYSNAAEHVEWRQDNGFYAYYNRNDQYSAYQSGLIREQHAITYTYAENGYLLEARDQQGYRTQYEYNENGDLTRASDSNAWALTHSDSEYYREMRQTLGIVDLSGKGKLVRQLSDADKAVLIEKHSSNYEYDDQGNLVRFLDNNDSETVFTYDEFNNLLSSTSPEANRLTTENSEEAQAKREELGFFADVSGLTAADIAAITELFTSRFVYDEKQNLIKRTDNGGDITSFEYDEYGNLSKQIVYLDSADLEDLSKQQITQYFYDMFGNNIETVDAEGNHTSKAYDHFGNITRSVDGNGGVSTFIYDNDNRLTAMTDPEGNTTAYGYDAAGNMISTTDANGQTVISIYDKNNRLITVIDPSKDDANKDRFTRFNYDVIGNQTSVTNAEGFKTTYHYDARRQLVEVHTPDFIDANGYANNYATRYTYDGLGNVLSNEDNNGNLTSYLYDQDSLLVEQTQPNGHITQFIYDENNNQVKIIAGLQLPEARRQILKFVHDEENQLVEQTDALGNTTKFALNAVGNQIEVVDANGNSTAYQYDANNRMVKQILPEVTDPKTGEAVRYTQELSYDANGNVVSTKNQNNEATNYFFDKNNRQVLIEDANSVFTRFSYDAKGQRTQVEIGVDMVRDLDGNLVNVESQLSEQSEYQVASRDGAQVVKYVYDEFGQIISETDGLGNALATNNIELYQQLRAELGFEALAENLTKADKKSLEDLYSKEFEYDRVGNLTKQIDQHNNETVFEYDALNRAIKTINTLGEATQFSFDGNGNQVKTVDALGRITEIKYDAYNRVIESIQAKGASSEVSTKLTYDAFGNLLTQVDAAGSIEQRTVSFEYDLNNRQTKATNAEGHAVSYEYDALGNRLMITDAKGQSSNYVYDALNRNIKVIDAMSFETHFEYDGVGNRLAIMDKNGNRVKYQYDPENQLISTVQEMDSGQDRITEFSYDARGNQVQMKTASGTANEEITLFNYDAQNNLRSVEDAEGGIISQNYDRLYNQTSSTDANGNTTATAFDALNRAVMVTDALGEKTHISYDAVGNQLSITDANNHTTQYVYDELNRRITSIDAHGVETQYVYDKVNNQTQISYANGTAEQVSESFEYYDDGQLKARIDGTGARTEYVYDKNNNTTLMTDPEGHTTQYTLDENNRVTSITDAEGGVTSYEYDANGNRIQVTDPEGHKVSSFYNAVNETVLKVDAEGYATSYQYDENGNQVSSTQHMVVGEVPTVNALKSLPSLVTSNLDQTTLYQYDALNRLVVMTDAEGFTTEYQYDAVGNRSSVVQQLNKETGEFSQTFNFYDATNRLTQTVSGEGLLTTFEYDAVGNRSSVNVYETAIEVINGQQPTAVEGDRVRTTQYSYDESNRVKEEISAEGYKTEYRYSKRGNRTQVIEAVGLPEQRITENEYDAANRIIKTTQALGSAAEVSAVFEYYADGQIQTRTDASGTAEQVTTHYIYDKNNRLVEQSKPNGLGASQVERFTYDAAGNRTQWVSAAGTVDERSYVYAYDKNNQLVSETMPFNGSAVITNEYAFDGAGNRTNAYLAVGTAETREQSWIFDRNNRVISGFNSAGVETAYVYDGAGNQVEIHENTNLAKDEAARITQQEFDLDNRLSKETSAQGNVTEYQYDALGNQILMSQLVNADTGTYANTHMYFDDQGRQTHVLSPEGNLVQFEYDAHGNLIKEIKYLESATVPAGHNVPQAAGETQISTFAYNELNQLVSQTNANGRIDNYEYDHRGNRITETLGINLSLASGPRVTHYQYNDANYLLSKTELLESNKTRITQFNVDSFGQVTQRIDAAQTDNSRTTQFTFDAQGNVLTEARIVLDQNGEQALLSSAYSYNAFGDLTNKVIAQGQADERQLSYEYDNGGRLVLEINAEQEKTHYQYDALGNQTVITQAYGTADARTLQNRFNLDNIITATIDATGVETRYEYDGVNNQVAMIEAFGTSDERRTESQFNLDNQLARVTDAMGYTTQFEYDALGNQTQIIQLLNVASEGQAAQYAETHQYFDLAGRLTHSINPEGYLSVSSYDEFDQLIESKQYLDPVLVSEDAPVVAGDAKVKATQYQYDISGNLVSETDALGVVNKSVYDLLGNRTQYLQNWDAQTAQAERVSSYEYDKQNRLTSRTDAVGTEQQVTTGFIYNNHGDVLSKIEAQGASQQRETHYQYDDAGRTLSESQFYTDEQGRIQELRTQYVYDELGNVTSQQTGQWDGVSLTVLRSQTFTYDKNNRLVTDTNAENEVSQYEYDAVGNQTVIHQGYGTQEQRSNYFEYNLLNQVSIATDGNGVQTQYQYDGLGNKTQTTQALGVFGEERITQYFYDLNSNLTDVIDPEGGHTHYVHDYLGNQVQTIDANKGVQNSAFDLLGRLSVSVTAGGIKTVVKYDDLGNKISEVTGWDNGSLATSENMLASSKVSKTFAYDSLGRQTTITDGNGFSTVMAYDLLGNQTSITKGLYLGSDVNLKALEHVSENIFTYDQAGRMLSMEDAQGNITTYSYNAVGDRLSKTEASNGLFDTAPRVTTFVYDNVGRQTHESTNGGSQVINTYNAVGDITKESILQSSTEGGNVWITTTKEYDGNGKLTHSVDDYGVVTHYKYDALGNKTDAYMAYGTQQQQQTRMVYDLNNRKITDVDGEGNTTTYEFDALGNQTVVTDALDRKAHYYYDGSNQVTAIVDAMGVVTQFDYDAQGNQKSYRVLATSIYDTLVNQATFASLSAENKLDIAQVSVFFDTEINDRVTSHNYDAVGNKISTQNPDGSISSYTFDAAGNMLSQTLFANVTDGQRLTSYTYDLNNRLINFVDLDGTITTFEYDAAGNKTAETVVANQDEQNKSRRTEYTYNLNNQNTKQISDVGGLNITQQSEYDIVGNEVAFIDANGNRTINVYDKNNRLTSSVDPEGNTSRNGYDKVGNRISATNGKQLTTTFVYDNNNRQTQVILPEATHYKLVGENWVESSYAATTTTVFDAFGNDTQTIDNDGFKTTRWFDANGRKTAELTSNNVLTTFEYNEFGEVKNHNLYLQRLSSAAHNPNTAPNVAGLEYQTTSLEYDLAGRLTTKTYPVIQVSSLQGFAGVTPSVTSSTERPVESFTYDAYGNQTSVTDKNGVTSFQFYDSLDRQIAVIDPAGYVTQWRYDAQGNTLEQFQYSSTVNATAITAGVMPQAFDFIDAQNTQYQIVRTYDAANRMVSEAMPEMATWDRTAGDAQSRVKTVFTYDANGNKIASTRAHGTNSAATEYFYFDGNNRQVAFVDRGGVLSTSQFDANGNVTTQKRYITRLPASTDFANLTAEQLVSLVGKSVNHDQTIINSYDNVNRLVAEKTLVENGDLNKTFKYDARGNKTSSIEHELSGLDNKLDAGSHVFKAFFETKTVYDGLGQIIQTVSPDGTGSIFEFDIQGNQVLSYTGDISSVPSMATNISARVVGDLEISWENSDRAFVIYDTVSHPTDATTDFKSLLSPSGYASRTGIATSSVNLGLAPGQSGFFRVVTVDAANNMAVSQEYNVEMPATYRALEIKEEAGQLVAYAEFTGEVENPSIELTGVQYALTLIADNQYKVTLPNVTNIQQDYNLVWGYNGETYTSDAISLSASQPHHVAATKISPSKSGDNYLPITEISVNGDSKLSEYETVSVEWIRESDQKSFVGMSLLDIADGVSTVSITTGEAEALTAGKYQVIIRGNTTTGTEVIQRFDHELNDDESTVRQFSMQLPNTTESSAYVVVGGEAKQVSSTDGYIAVNINSAASNAYNVFSGSVVAQNHTLDMQHNEIWIPAYTREVTDANGDVVKDANGNPVTEEVPAEYVSTDNSLKLTFTPEELAAMSGGLTLQWGLANATSSFANSQTLQADANGVVQFEFPELTDGQYDLKLSYTNANGEEVIVDWLRFSQTDDTLIRDTNSTIVQHTERGGSINGDSLNTGLFTGDVSLTSAPLTVAAVTSDDGQGFANSTGKDRGYFSESKYDAMGNKIATNEDDGVWREYKVDAMGNQIMEVSMGKEENLDTTTYRTSFSAFDALGRETKMWSAVNANSTSGHEITHKEYDYAGNVVKEIHANGSYTSFEFNAVGLKTKETYHAANHGVLRQENYGFNALGEETRMTDALGYGTEKVYDQYGNVTREYMAKAGSASTDYKAYEYDAFGRRTLASEYMAGNDVTVKKTEYTYNQADQLTKVTEGKDSANPLTTTFVLDSRGNRLMTTTPDENGLGTVEIYDEFGRVITRLSYHGEERVSESKSYDVFGNLISETDQMGRTKTKVYGGNGLLMQERDEAGHVTTYEYDAFDNQTKVIKIHAANVAETDPNVMPDFSGSKFNFDGFDFLSQAITPAQDETVKTYDAQNRLISTEQSSQTAKIGTYDWDSQTYSYSGGESTKGINTTYTYDEMGNRATEVVKNNNTVLRNITYGYSDQGEMTSWADSKTGAHLNYAFDASGRLISVKTNEGYNPDVKTDKGTFYQTNMTYEYNSQGQLENVKTWNNDTQLFDTTDSYTYFANGLMKTSTQDRITYSYEYNARGDVIRSDWTKTHENQNKAHYSTWQYDEYGNTTRFETHRITVTEVAAVYRRGQLISAARTDVTDTAIQVDTSIFIKGTTLASSTTSINDDLKTTVTTTTFDQSGRSLKTDINGPGSHIWYDTTYTASGLKLKDTLNGDSTSKSTVVTTYTDYMYDANDKMSSFTKTQGTGDEREERRTFIYNSDGQILSRDIFDKTQSSGQYDTEYHYANGEAVAHTGQNEEGTKESKLGVDSYSQVKHLGDEFPSGTLSSFTATGGETLQQVAGMLLGNSNLWFVLAEANGLQAGASLNAGQTISIPNSVETGKIDADSHKVYSESEIIGNTMPNVRQEKKKKKCGSFLAIIITVVVIAVAAALTGGAALAIAGSAFIAGLGTAAAFVATVALSALAGAAIYAGMNIVQQGLMIAAGLQESFSWSQVRDQAKQGAVAGALAGMGSFGELERAKDMQSMINVSKVALNVASKAYFQMEANGGKISNWSGILMAATPALGEYEALQSTAEMVEEYGDYASPWLNMAEKAINGDTIRSEDYLMAVGNTLSTAIDTNTSYLGDTLSKIVAKTTVAGAMYLGDKETANTYFNEMVGQEVGSFLAGYAGSQMSGFTGEKDSQGFKAGMAAASVAITAGISSYTSTFVSNRMGGMSARDSFAEAYSGLGQSMNDAVTGSMAKTSRATAARADIFGMAMDAATNTQRMDFGTIKNLQIVDELNDGEDKAYGAFDSATGKVMVSRDLMNKAQSGDQDAAAHLLGLLKEELSHREAQAAEQALNIKDYPFDEGALAARQMLQALGEHDGRTAFTFNANDEGFDFETSADAINKAVDDKFGWGRILSDRQSGSLEFNSGNTADNGLSNENLAAMLAQNPDFDMKSEAEQQGMIDQLRQSTNSYYDGVMDQAVTDGSLATYMLAAGAQGLANVGLGLAGLFDASTDDLGSTARGTIKSVANFGPEAFNGAVNLTKTVLDGYSYGLDAVGIDASGFRETEAFNLGLNMEYANEAEQGGALLGGLLGGAAASKFGQHRVIIDDIGTTNRQAGAINVRIEGPEVNLPSGVGGTGANYDKLNGQGLYVLRDEAGAVGYVGRGDAPKRIEVHANSSDKSDLVSSEIVWTNNLDKATSKGLEQRLMDNFGGAKSQNPNTPLQNKIRSYSPENPNAPTYEASVSDELWAETLKRLGL
jgi:YD repeat-containing protein